MSERDFREKTAVFTEHLPIQAISVKKHKSRIPLIIRQKIRLFIGTISRRLPLEIAVSGGGYSKNCEFSPSLETFADIAEWFLIAI